jgi:SAM-dependent methyltransferase
VNLQRWLFELRYWLGRTPWDTDITPPEVIAFLQRHPPGRALDLGCGTGTNVITLAQWGWQVTGIDFSRTSIWIARRKVRRARLTVDLRVADATDLSDLQSLYDFALDIGCLHAVEPAGRGRYAAGLERLVRPDGHYMLYAWLPRPRNDATRGISQDQVEALFTPAFQLIRSDLGDDRGSASAWYWMVRQG